MRRRTFAFLAIGLAVLVALALAGRLLLREDSLERLRRTGVIRIGYAVEAPYAYLDMHGDVTGESPEVARQVIQAMGIKHIQWRLAEFGSLIQELLEHRIDMIAAGMFITPDRARLVAFSRPTFHVQQALLVAAGNPRDLHSYRDAVDHDGVTVAALSGSVEAQAFQSLGLPQERLLLAPDATTALAALESGLADALALSSPTLRYMALSDAQARIELAKPFAQTDLGRPFAGYGAFAFRKEDKALLDACNQVLETYVGSPEHLALIATFGFTREELPGDVGTEDILAP